MIPPLPAGVCVLCHGFGRAFCLRCILIEQDQLHLPLRHGPPGGVVPLAGLQQRGGRDGGVPGESPPVL